MQVERFLALLDNIVLLSIVALGLLTPVVYSGYAFLLKASFTHLFITLIFGLWLLKVIVKGRIHRPRHQLLIPLSALILVSALSLSKAVNVEAGIREIYRLALFVILYFIAVEALQQKDRWRFIAVSMLLGGLLTCLVGFYQFYNPGSSFLWAWSGEFIGAIGNRTYLGGYLLTLIPLSVALLFLSDSWPKRVAWGVALVVLNVSIVLTRSRAAWLGLAVGLLLMTALVQKGKFLRSSSHKTLQVKEMLAILAILLSSWGTGVLLFAHGEPSQTGLFQASLNPNVQSRVSYWWDSLNMIWDNPLLGVGAGNFTSVFFRYADLPQGPFTENVILEHPHNEYIGLVAELGVMGLLVFSWLVFRIGRIGWKALKESKEREQALRLSSLLGCLVSVAVNASLFYPFHEPSTSLNLFLILSLLEVASQRMPQETENVIAGQVGVMTAIKRGAIWAMICIISAALFYTLSFRPLMGSYYFIHSVKHFVQAKLDESVRAVKRSLSWDPSSFLPRFLLAQNYFSMGKYSEAIRESEKLLELYPYVLFPFDMIAMSHIAKGETSKAMEAYERALKVNPKLTTALVNLAVLHLKQKEYDKAQVLLERAVRVAPEKFQVHMNLGTLYQELGQTGVALTFYYEAVRRNPSLPHTWYAIAGLEAQKGKVSETLYALGRAFSLDPALRAQAKIDAAFNGVSENERFKRIVGQ